jgi:hypothetical protein
MGDVEHFPALRPRRCSSLRRQTANIPICSVEQILPTIRPEIQKTLPGTPFVAILRDAHFTAIGVNSGADN